MPNDSGRKCFTFALKLSDELMRIKMCFQTHIPLVKKRKEKWLRALQLLKMYQIM